MWQMRFRVEQIAGNQQQSGSNTGWYQVVSDKDADKEDNETVGVKCHRDPLTRKWQRKDGFQQAEPPAKQNSGPVRREARIPLIAFGFGQPDSLPSR
jgi:hypothetical protein